MKKLFIFIIICGAVIYGAKHITKKMIPEKRLKEINEGVLKFYKDNNRMPKELVEAAKEGYFDKEYLTESKMPPQGVWAYDMYNEENPVRIYYWKYYKCPECGSVWPIKQADFPVDFKCEKCNTRVKIDEEDLFEKTNESLMEQMKK